jgi:hypothetical protein
MQSFSSSQMGFKKKYDRVFIASIFRVQKMVIKGRIDTVHAIAQLWLSGNYEMIKSSI